MLRHNCLLLFIFASESPYSALSLTLQGSFDYYYINNIHIFIYASDLIEVIIITSIILILIINI